MTPRWDAWNCSSHSRHCTMSSSSVAEPPVLANAFRHVQIFPWKFYRMNTIECNKQRSMKWTTRLHHPLTSQPTQRRLCRMLLPDYTHCPRWSTPCPEPAGISAVRIYCCHSRIESPWGKRRNAYQVSQIRTRYVPDIPDIPDIPYVEDGTWKLTRDGTWKLTHHFSQSLRYEPFPSDDSSRKEKFFHKKPPLKHRRGRNDNDAVSWREKNFFFLGKQTFSFGIFCQSYLLVSKGMTSCSSWQWTAHAIPTDGERRHVVLRWIGLRFRMFMNGLKMCHGRANGRNQCTKCAIAVQMAAICVKKGANPCKWQQSV